MFQTTVRIFSTIGASLAVQFGDVSAMVMESVFFYRFTGQ